jgi:maltose/maltodextrin transport system substrate-binding protein/arabinogalactan oligomer/maltooligosaccharide transport system substrate-binding protein
MLKFSKVVTLVLVAAFALAACAPVATATPTQPAVQPTATNAPATATLAPTGTTAPTATAAAAGTATVQPTPTITPMAAKEGTLTIWVDAGRLKAVKDLGAQFTAKYNVPVAVQEMGFGDIRDQLRIAGPAGEGPDLIIGAHDWLGELVTNGLLEPLDLGNKAASFDPVSLKAFTYNGKLYGMPYAVEAIALFYNKDLVPTPPATWDEMIATAKKLQDEGKVEQGYVMQQGDPYHTYPLLSGYGGYVFGRNTDGSYNPKDLGLDSAGSLASAEELDSLVKQGILRKDVTFDIMATLFKTGKAAFMITGPWELSDVRSSGVHYGVAKIPMMKQTPRPFVGVQGFMVSAFAKNKLLAKTFLTEFVATDAAMQSLYEAVPNGPAWLPLRDKMTDADLKVFAQSAADGDPMPAIPQMSAVWEAWTKAIVLIFQQQQAPDQAFKDAATSIRQLIANGS